MGADGRALKQNKGKASGAIWLRNFYDFLLTVSQICSFICFPSIVIIRAPNSTPEEILHKMTLLVCIRKKNIKYNDSKNLSFKLT